VNETVDAAIRQGAVVATRRLATRKNPLAAVAQVEPGQVEAEAHSPRVLDAALADVVEVVARQRMRMGRRACSRHDAETIRRVFELLRGLMAEASADTNPSFP
jgi:hypothetical protein